MRVQDYVADQTERMGAALAHFIRTTDASRLDWQPQIPGAAQTRSVLEQVGECVDVNRKLAALINRADLASAPGFNPDVAFAGADDAAEQLILSVRELTAAIGAMSDSDLTSEFQHPRARIKGANLILMPLRNMAYHAGQINMIQMLAGDSEFHVPPNWR
jgi:hypothetical protein